MRTPTNERLSPDIAEDRAARASEPERRCVLSAQTHPRSTMLRLAISPEGKVLPDPLGKAPGRGAWIAVPKRALQDAATGGALKSALQRAFKGAPMVIADDLSDQAERGLIKAFLGRAGLEMRAGHLMLGSERIAERARAGGVHWLAHACDAREDGTKKLDQAWRVGSGAEGSDLRGTRLPLDRAALSVALGRENVVHLASCDFKAAQRLGQSLDRLLHFAGDGPVEAEGDCQN